MTPEAEEQVLAALGELKAETKGINARLDTLNGSVARLKQQEYERSLREAEARGVVAGLSQAVLTRRQLTAVMAVVGAIATLVQLGLAVWV